ncbi:ABC transporter substrate-binding protein [Caenimonas koreensis DSM 17982]|uniref:ABC transporter substrate-binding protein n=1 Tax=Caenimonas koreensis DSM 17982 TaxID=1121255 RepID=A0A844B953_9BURK|nr:ABC transporter substrate-binding protein [Caenimonas koreensis]MRD48129.1 ABC transporter substrate-binding protein [Caenimonas koreensis DSM 17982]
MAFTSLTRRGAILAGCALAAAPRAFAQPAKPAAGARAVTVAQLFDTSATQQDVSKDFLIGSRAAWQDINLRGGLHGRAVQHTSIEVDGSAASVRAAIAQLRDNPSVVVLSGTAGDITAGHVVATLKQERLGIAHVAPWLQNSSLDIDERTFPIFAARQEQIVHALKSLTVMSVQEIGAVYASDVEFNAYQQEFERSAADLKIKLQTFRAGGDLIRLGQKLTQTTPAILLFVGGTPELAQFTQGLEKQSRQRYVVALADVNLQTLMQMGAARNTPIIATQAVPVVTASVPVVRMYREALAKLFDEPPTPLSLAGFIAARYTFEVLRDADANLTRQSALAAFQRRANLDVGGFRVSFDQRRRGGTFVTQSMLTQDGRVIG